MGPAHLLGPPGTNAPAFRPDANLITGLVLDERGYQVTGNVKYFRLEAHRVDGSRDFFIRHIYKRKDADQVLASVQALLAQQR